MENELLEWIIVDSLMFREVSYFGESIKEYSPDTHNNLNPHYFSAKGNIEMIKRRTEGDYFENLRNKFIGFIVTPLLIAFFSYLYIKKWAVLGAATYYSLLTIFFIIRGAIRLLTRKAKGQDKKAISKSIELFSAMSKVYKILEDGTISPNYLREKLYETSKLGALWPSAVFMIVDHAIKRNPAIWNSPKSLEYEKY